MIKKIKDILLPNGTIGIPFLVVLIALAFGFLMGVISYVTIIISAGCVCP